MIYTYTSSLRTGSTWEVMQFRKRGWASCILNLYVKETRTEWYDLVLKSLINYIVYPYRQFCLLENNRVKNYAQIHPTFTINLDSRSDWLRSSRIPRTRKTRLSARRRGRSSVSSLVVLVGDKKRQSRGKTGLPIVSSTADVDGLNVESRRDSPLDRRGSSLLFRGLPLFALLFTLRSAASSPHAAPQVRGATESRSRLAHQLHSPHTLVVLLGFSSTHTSSCVSIRGCPIVRSIKIECIIFVGKFCRGIPKKVISKKILRK